MWKDLADEHSLALRRMLAANAAFDLALGLGALLVPGFYNRLMHPTRGAGGADLLQRTAVIWLGLAASQALAAAGRREALLFAAGLRFLESPADLVYRLRAPDLGGFGKAVLSFTPAANLLLGAIYLRAWARRREI